MSVLHRERRRRAERGRLVLQALHRQELREAGESLRVSQQGAEAALERIGRGVRGAVASGIPMTEIAELVGLNRQRLYELKDRHDGSGLSGDSQVLATIAAEGAMTLPQLASQMEVKLDLIEPIVERLATEKLVQPLIAGYEDPNTRVTYLGLTRDGEDLLRDLAFDHPDLRRPEHVVYVALEPTEEEALSAAAVEMFGAENFAIVSPGTVTGQQTPELAFRVPASTPQECITRGRERILELRDLADLPPGPVVITAISPGD